MIPPRQLQLGNWVQDEQGLLFRIDVLFPIHEGFSSKMKELGGDNTRTLYSDKARPVKLSEAWLTRRFGFELFPWGFVKDNLLIRTSKSGNNPRKFWIEFGNGLRTQFEYVHRLQNFYFEAFDKELEK